MMSYNSSEVIQCIRQYEMFANSLKLIKTKEERDMIIKQLTKLESKIIELTDEMYEEEYYTLYNKKCELFDDEKKRLTMLLDLINQRLTYVEKQCNNHYHITGESIDVSPVLGADTLDSLEEKIKIIDKYIKNKKQEKQLRDDVKALSNKISLASEKISINESLNEKLESTFKSCLADAFEKCGMYSLLDAKEDIEYAYYETEKSLNLAKLNVETAKKETAEMYNDCLDMLEEVQKDYDKYKEQISVIQLLDLFNEDVHSYEELLDKRKEVNEIVKCIKNREFLNMIMDVLLKQYNTILMEQQDVNTYNDLMLEKERKLEAIASIEEENESPEFQDTLKTLIDNEKKRQEEIEKEQKKIEEAEKKKRLEIERKKQEEILRRQKIIEETRKKEIEKRTKQLLEQQQNSVLQPKKHEEKVSFDTIKNITDTAEEQVDLEKNKIEETMVEEKSVKEVPYEKEIPHEKEETVLFKNKVDIEKELFDEFNNIKTEKEIPIAGKHEEGENKLPDMSIDEYMKNFDEKKVNNISNIFDDDDFPSIPI